MQQKKTWLKASWSILKDTYKEFNNDNVIKLSAALAYYTIFSLVPMLIVIIGLGSIFFGKEAMQGKVFAEMQSFVGAEAASGIQDTLKKTNLHYDNFLATIVGFITLLLGATGMFGEIQDSINSIWGLKTNPKRGFVKLILNRVTSFSMVLVLGFLLLVSLVFNALLQGLLHRLKHFFSESFIENLFFIDYIITAGIIAILFAFIFKVLPDAKVLWKDIWIGAFVTSILFLLGEHLIAYYLGHNASLNTYGAAGSVIVILIWVYYSAIILYIGAEFTQVYVRERGRSIKPNKYAIWVEKKLVEKKSNTQIKDSPR